MTMTMLTMMTMVDVVNREKPPQKGGGVVITGDRPRPALLVGAAGPAADDSTRAAAVAGAMLGVLAGVVSLVWALYAFKPGVGRKPAGSVVAGAPAEVEPTPGGSQVTPLLLPSTATVQAESVGAADVSPTPGDVDLANYFSPMTTTTTTTRGVQADLDGWTVSSALAAQSGVVEEVTTARGGGPSAAAATTNVAIQTANLHDGAPAGSAAVHSTSCSYESRTVTDTARDTSQVRRSPACFADLNRNTTRRNSVKSSNARGQKQVNKSDRVYITVCH